ncbi:MAG: Cof-type HAD-IIB family hydrolase [Treponema sp.]|jgi:Cof subfamily protein (haloacid dehalogenase superfamily)|nr:Cof-type HAD-IIB family hydrolase [Treponema sp.]
MVKMIVMDLDGTLLTDDKTISNYTLSVLEKCKNRGIKIVLATARSEKSAKRCIELVKPDSMILNGGALVLTNDQKIMYKKLLSVETSDGILHECVNNKNVRHLTAETETKYYVSYKEPAYHPDYTHGEYYDFSNPLSQETYKITAEITDRKIALDIENRFTESTLISFSGENWHRFAHKEAGKIDALYAVANHESIPLSEIMAFGDDYNDIEMIKNCGIGIAMENGIDEIKRAAKYICGKNNEDGIGKWIEKTML